MDLKYKQLENEGSYEYDLQLIEMKVRQNPSDLEWSDIVDPLGLDVHYDGLHEAANVTPCSGYHAMRYSKQKATQDLESAHLDEIEREMLESKRECRRFFGRRNAFSKVVRDLAHKDENSDISERAVTSGIIPRLDYVPCVVESSRSGLLVSLNDLHFGACVDNYWNYYSSDVCVRLPNEYLDRILEISALHGSESCYVWANRDLISKNIHKSIAISNRKNVIQQVVGVSGLLAGSLSTLNRYFKNVYFSPIAENHPRFEEEDVASVHERPDNLVEWHLKARLQSFESVSFDYYRKIGDTMYLLDIRGKTYFDVHGDYDRSAGKVQSLQTITREPVYTILSGHLHYNKTDSVQGAKTIMADSFLGMDDYCVRKRIYGTQQQLVCVCDYNDVKAFYDIDFDTTCYHPQRSDTSA